VVERDLAVGLATDIAAQEIRQPFVQLLDRLLTIDVASVAEEPVAEPKWLCVLGARRAVCGNAHVCHDALRLYVAGEGGQIDDALEVCGTLSHQRAIALVVAQTPTIEAIFDGVG